MKIINYDKNKFSVGNSIYGKEYQVEINEQKINNSNYMNLVMKALKLLKQKTTQHRKETIINYKAPKQKTIREYINKAPYKERYDRTLVAIIKKNEQERKSVVEIAKLLAI